MFVSYAHVDGFDFTRRLVAALEMYADVFWDKHLETGPFPKQLYDEIEARKFFVLVMTPLSLRKNGWCRKELAHAQRAHDNGIVLAKRYSSKYPTEFVRQLESNYTYGDFRVDFEAGFRSLTQQILGEPRSSWEHLADENNSVVMQYFQHGQIPGLIAKSLAEWVIVDKVWLHIDTFLNEPEEQGKLRIIRGTPRTFSGVAQQCNYIFQRFAQDRDFIGIHMIQEIRKLVIEFAEEFAQLKDDDHAAASQLALQIIDKAEKFVVEQYLLKRDFMKVKELQDFFAHDVVEKLKELLRMHSRRSRYLW